MIRLDLILGLDPGVHGAWALLSADEILIATGDLHLRIQGGRDWNAGLREGLRRWGPLIRVCVLEEGMYFACETFAGHPGLEQTVRLEENLLVTKEGPVLFTKHPFYDEALA